MKATAMYEAKRALMTALAAQTGTGQPLDGIMVAYSYPFRDITERCIYGGGIRSTQNDDQGAAEYRVLGYETITIGTYIRILRKDAAAATVRDSDAEAEDVAQAISDVLSANPKLAGNLTWVGIEAGQSDYAETPEGPETVLALQLNVRAFLT